MTPSAFDLAYIAAVVRPFERSMRYVGETPTLPMVDLALSKEQALGPHLWGLFYDGWRPAPESEGTTVFVEDYARRGPDNQRKRIFMAATTPDLYDARYRGKVLAFLDRLFAPANAGRPLLREYFAHYDDLFWDLHLGATGDAIPPDVREFGAAFAAVLALGPPTDPLVYRNYLRVRELRPAVRRWIDGRLDAADDATFAYYWLRNGLRREDIVIECLHDLLAMGQWSYALHRFVPRLAEPEIAEAFRATMADPDSGTPFTALDHFVMELFRTVSPNPATVSALRRQDQADDATPAPATGSARHAEPGPTHSPGSGPLAGSARHAEPGPTHSPGSGPLAGSDRDAAPGPARGPGAGLLARSDRDAASSPRRDPDAGLFAGADPGLSPALILTSHVAASTDPRHWERPLEFDPGRYRSAPTSADARSGAAGLARCPFEPASFAVRDGRDVVLVNGEFGAVYSVAGGVASPVCDSAGYAPFGFGYRRCPAELLTVAFMKDVLRRVWRDRLTFADLGLAAPERLPCGSAMVEDNVGFASEGVREGVSGPPGARATGKAGRAGRRPAERDG
ncbi:hypothetical protein ABZS66_35520 [Dactylosporangium sp. NPDC005572]|uniref:hypothetical protein n=1 Tax=Dactylosporangium sp. NPDC005572 TaxID=3156889 RepID=UPI0033AA18B2